MNTSVFQQLKIMIIDVDGTMTDGGIYYDENGNELKKFNTRDAAAFFVMKKLGIDVVVLTGRLCVATSRRMAELGVEHVYQGIKDKTDYIKRLASVHNISTEQIGYIGDDLNDYSPMSMCSFKACPADSCKEIKSIADYISSKNGGDGVIRDIVESALDGSETWQNMISEIYGLSGV